MVPRAVQRPTVLLFLLLVTTITLGASNTTPTVREVYATPLSTVERGSGAHAVLEVERRWVNPDVQFCVDASTRPPDMTAELFEDFARQAAQAVNTLGSKARVTISGPCTSPAVYADGKNGIRFQDNLSSFVEGAAVGLTERQATGSGFIVEADVSLELNLDPGGSPSSWSDEPACSVSVLAHEFGHALGFNHSEIETDLMAPSGSCAVLRFSEREQQMMTAAYGADPSSVPVSPVGVQAVLYTERQSLSDEPGSTDESWSPRVSWATSTPGEVAALSFCGSDLIRTSEVQCDRPGDIYWPQRGSGSLTVIPFIAGQTHLERETGFELVSGPATICTAAGCTDELPMFAGTAFVGTDLSRFSFVVLPTDGGGARISLLNAPWIEAGVSIAHSFEVRVLNATTGERLASCALNPGAACNRNLSAVPAEIAIVVPQGTAQAGIAFETGDLPAASVAGETPAAPTPTAPTGEPPYSGVVAPQGVSFVIWNGGAPDLATGMPAGLRSLWVAVGGRFVGYTFGAPAFVNQAFLATVGAEIAAGTPVALVVR